ncbi:MAG: sulfite exporter TauE/SafE family protein [Deltaproteobacteria bacterium]|nr:sulfite exporter TauE/SafE family protein [Deltaproteobacteria bacterium]
MGGASSWSPSSSGHSNRWGGPDHCHSNRFRHQSAGLVLPTALSGAITHHRKKAVLWRAGVTFGIVGAIGAFGGAFIASRLPGKVLTTAFGVAVILGGIRMLTAKPPKIDEAPSVQSGRLYSLGHSLGIVSRIIGIGGGVLMIPIMIWGLKFKMHQAVGTSTALMIFTAIGGALSYWINGSGIQGLPPYSTGYLNWYQWITLAGVSIPWAGGRS